LKHIHVISDPEKELYHLYGVESSIIKRMSTLFSSKYASHLKAVKELGLQVNKEEKDFDQNLIPADFLIDASQQLEAVHYGKNLTDRMDEELIVNFAEAEEPTLSR
ncbi:MAG: hypothetical protein AAGI07_03280, partial [Bacteroidota bacterium]